MCAVFYLFDAFFIGFLYQIRSDLEEVRKILNLVPFIYHNWKQNKVLCSLRVKYSNDISYIPVDTNS